MSIYLIYKSSAYQLEPGQQYNLGQFKTDDILMPLNESVLVQVDSNQVIIDGEVYSEGKQEIRLSEGVTFQLLVLPRSSFVMLPSNLIYISGESPATISYQGLKAELTLESNSPTSYTLTSSHPYYLNGHVSQLKTTIQENDQILLEEGLFLSIRGQLIELTCIYPLMTDLLQFTEIEVEEDRAGEFHRSPRIILREPEEKIRIASPPTNEEPSKQSLLKLLVTPVAMIVFTTIMYFMSAGGGMMFMMMGMSVITIFTSLHSYFSDKKDHKVKQVKKLQEYMKYLDGKYVELARYHDEQRDALLYHYPSTEKILDMARNVDRRIYEKTPHHFDFLSYRLGLGQVKPSFEIDYNDTELTQYNKKAGKKVQELLNHYRFLHQVPLHNEINSPIGYIGNRRVVIEQVQQLMMQIATFHSYHDVQFLPVFREEEYSLWSWSRWLPHVKIQAFNSRGFIYNQRTRDQLLTSLYQLIKERKLDSEQDRDKEKQYVPQYVLFITDLSLLLDHNIMEYINEDLSYLGIHYIFVEEVLESLPEHVKTVIDIRGDKKAHLILQDGIFVDKNFAPLPAISIHEKEDFARNMASINHVQTMRNSIPNSITFLEMYGVNKVEELQLLQRWQENETYQTMAVPLGVRGRDDLLYLNLHEKAHGPHGLIAGTTGSGKSELVQSYILSLAVNYHPYEVAFLLIDYKGGGMAHLFSNLPHLVGTITNLDANQANRALVSIKAELKKRQRVFLENDVNHINQYTKLFKQGKVTEPLPHLFIISDEFAELKAEQPDFMDELVSTARIGRSLGIHLILATQKPSGVVNDQIWSNSKFKIALKVQDVADSREVIKTPDAAEITQTGRAYLQVGNNEIYELFQSAWSGADYNPDGKNQVQRDTTIYEIKENGQYEAINKDLSGLDKVKEIKALPTELDAVVQEAENAFQSTGLEKVASPWLPPLEEKVYARDLQSTDFNDYWEKGFDEPSILIGYQDIPEQQSQSPLYFTMSQIGHILMVSSPGFGKSTFLQSFAVDIMRKQTPKQAHFYLYDFGTSGLISLSDFPHTADYFALDETEKIMKSLRMLNKEIKRRKKALSRVKATNLNQYNQMSDEAFPTIYILIDGFDSVADASFGEHFYDVLNVIARDGASLGVYLAVTLSRLNAMRLQLQSNFKTKLSLFLFDTGDLSGVVGRSNIPMDEIKGRAMAKFDDIVQFQITLPYSSEYYTDYIQEVKAEVEQMRAAYTGPLPANIPMLPEKVTVDYFKDIAAGRTFDSEFILGLDGEDVEPTAFKLNCPILMVSDNPTFVGNYYKLLEWNLERLGRECNAVLLDPSQKVSKNYLPNVQRFTNSLEVENVLKTILKDLKERMASPEESYQKWLVIIPDMAATGMAANMVESDVELLVSEAGQYGVTAVLVGSYQDLVNNTYDNYVKQSRHLIEQVFLGMRISDQDHTRYPYINNEPSVKAFEGYVLHPEGYTFVQLVNV